MKHRYLPHLIPETFVISPGREWRVPFAGWWLIHVRSGSGYVLSQPGDGPLEPDVAIRVSPLWTGTLRASQLSQLELRAARLDWLQLMPLVTPIDEQFFQRAQNDPEFSFRSFPALHPIAKAASQLFLRTAVSLAFRVNALSLFLETLGPQFAAGSPVPNKRSEDAAERVKKILAETPLADLVHLELHDFVLRAKCTSRHLRRIFREILGVSFREKQTQIRLDRAVQLLSRSENKILDVALESGFGSVSLFNTQFKRRFRMQPRQLREELRSNSGHEKRRGSF